MRRSTSRRGASMVLALAVMGCLTACPPTTTTPTAVHAIDPCVTDATITCDRVGHLASAPTGAARDRLVILVNGTGAAPSRYQKLVDVLAGDGYHVVAVRYPSGIGTKDACPDIAVVLWPECHRAFRGETTFGENVADPAGNAFDSPAISVPAADSFTNRLLQLMAHLDATYPDEGWGRYVDTTDGACTTVVEPYGACDLRWADIAVVGHSNGAGVALYLSKFHGLARLAMISGPFDEYRVGSSWVVAPWIVEGGFATPAADMVGLTHRTEPNAGGQSAAWDALGLALPQVPVDNPLISYAGAQQLTTNVVPECGLDPNGQHNSTAQDECTPGSPPALRAVWRYLAGS